VDELIPIHDRLLQAVALIQGKLSNLELTTSFPIRGLASTSELMVVGRAVNGWGMKSWKAPEAVDPIRRNEIIREVIEPIKSAKGCPMDWIINAWGNTPKGLWNAKRSSFCRLIFAVSQSVFGTIDQWSSRLIWSNLYKVAPYQGGNPSTRLCTAQQDWCEAHLAKEVELWKPKRILFITGWNWAQPFVERLGRSVEPHKAGLVEWSGVVKRPGGSLSVVVSSRPERRPVAAMAEQVVEAFDQNNSGQRPSTPA
jgi:hypothetical protein